MDMMRAAVLKAPGTYELRSVPVPAPPRGHVRLRMEGSGVCGSNLEAWRGRPWFQYPLPPGASGHEGWGTIDAVGDDVRRFRVGDRVAALTSNGFADFEVIPETGVTALPDVLHGSPFPGEAIGCAMNIFARCRVLPGETVAVVGIGFLGALLVQLASRRGARVIAISRRDFPLEVARRMGARDVFRLENPPDVLQGVREATGGALCDCVIEAVGLQAPLDLAGELARESGRLVIAGYHQNGSRQVNLGSWNWRALDIVNAHERNPVKNLGGIREAAQAVADGTLDPASLYTHRFPLAEIGDAFRCLSERPDGFMKALVVTA
jgi:threonine dehydrogenase-like Zn-dependent dehydrogenase